MVIPVRDDGGLDQGDGLGGEKWWDSGYRINRAPAGLEFGQCKQLLPQGCLSKQSAAIV